VSARLFSMKTDAACVNLSNLVTSNVTKPEILNNCICVFHLCFLFVLYLRLPFFHICIFDFVIALYRFAFASFICVLTHGLHLHLCLCCQRTRQKCRDQSNVRTLSILSSNDVKIYMFPSRVCELCVCVCVCVCV